MFLEKWKTKPKNNEFILLDTIGDISNPITLQPKKYYQAKDITNIVCTVYNDDTDRVSDKSAYIDKNGRLYLKTKGRGRLYLDEFK